MVPGSRPVQPVEPVGAADRFPVHWDTLRNPDRLDEWFDWATATGFCVESDKRRVFRLASYFIRAAAKKMPGQKPLGVGAFLKAVREGKNWGSNEDDVQAEKVLRELSEGE
jgi:hypothetical protein